MFTNFTNYFLSWIWQLLILLLQTVTALLEKAFVLAANILEPCVLHLRNIVQGRRSGTTGTAKAVLVVPLVLVPLAPVTLAPYHFSKDRFNRGWRLIGVAILT